MVFLSSCKQNRQEHQGRRKNAKLQTLLSHTYCNEAKTSNWHIAECKIVPIVPYIWFSYIYNHYSSLGWFIWLQHNDQLPVGLLAQLLERCIGIAEVMGSNPVRAWILAEPGGIKNPARLSTVRESSNSPTSNKTTTCRIYAITTWCHPHQEITTTEHSRGQDNVFDRSLVRGLLAISFISEHHVQWHFVSEVCYRYQKTSWIGYRLSYVELS